jgi:hypothetical protein
VPVNNFKKRIDSKTKSRAHLTVKKPLTTSLIKNITAK